MITRKRWYYDGAPRDTGFSAIQSDNETKLLS